MDGEIGTDGVIRKFLLSVILAEQSGLSDFCVAQDDHLARPWSSN
jgi:hypothetical protein